MAIRVTEAKKGMVVRVLCGVFFVSGVSALIVEAVWFHQCGLVFGNSV